MAQTASDPQERRAKYFEDREKAVETLEKRSFEYEKLAVEYSNSAFKILTYLNGGALIAIPTALSLSNSKAADHWPQIRIAAGIFVAGLVSVLASQMFAFFTMAKRSEAQQAFANQQAWLSGLTHYPEQYNYAEAKKNAEEAGTSGTKKLNISNRVRIAALVFAWLSAGLFIAGCLYSAAIFS